MIKRRIEGINLGILALYLSIIMIVLLSSYAGITGYITAVNNEVSCTHEIDKTFFRSDTLKIKLNTSYQNFALLRLSISGKIISKGDVNVYLQLENGEKLSIIKSSRLREQVQTQLTGMIAGIDNASIYSDNGSLINEILEDSGVKDNVFENENASPQALSRKRLIAKEFSDECLNTCNLLAYNLTNKEIELVIEIDKRAILKIDSINYSLYLFNEKKENKTLNNLTRSNLILENAEGEKIKDDPEFETFFDKIERNETHLLIQLHHNSSKNEKVWIDRNINYLISDDNPEPEQIITILIPLINERLPKLELHVGDESDVFRFGDYGRIRKLAERLKAFLARTPEIEATKTNLEGIKEIIISEKDNNIAELTVDFSKDIDFGKLNAETDYEEGKSVLHMDNWPEDIKQKNLLIPVIKNTGIVYVCPEAESLNEVTPKCRNRIILSLGRSYEGMSLSLTTIKGINYYLLTNISGTGAGELREFNSTAGTVTGTYESTYGTHTDTHLNDNEYGAVGETRIFTTINAQIELDYDISSLGICETDISELIFNITYCHSGANSAPPSCNGDSAEGTPNGNQDVYVYNHNTTSWDDIGNLRTNDGGNEITDSYSINSSITDYVSDSGIVRVAYEVDYYNSWLQDTWLVIDHAPLGVQAPNFYDWEQNPSDLNTTSGDNLLIRVNISSSSNISEARIFYNNTGNSQQAGIIPEDPGYVNLTLIDGTLTNGRWEGNISHWFYRPSKYNLFVKEINDFKNNYTDIYGNNSVKVEFTNIYAGENVSYRYDLYLDNKSETLNDLNAFYCNSSYNNGDVSNSNNCAYISGFEISDPELPYGRKYLTIKTNSEGYISNNVKLTSNSSIIITAKDIINLNASWSLRKQNITSKTGNTYISFNNGQTWELDDEWEADVHVHWFDYKNNQALQYYGWINNSLGETFRSVCQTDLWQTGADPPSKPHVLNPEFYESYKNDLNITWIKSNDPNDDSFDYNVSLMNEDGSFNKTINSSIPQEINYQVYDTTDSSDGRYKIKVTSCDNGNDCSYDLMAYYFIIDNNPPIIELNNPSNNEEIGSNSVNFNWTAIDKTDDHLKCNLTIDSVMNQTNIPSLNNTPTNFTIEGISPGEHSWNITCMDDAGNINTSETRSFNIILPPPEIILPENITYGSLSLELNVSFDRVINQSWYSLNSGANITLCKNKKYCNTSITAVPGSNIIIVYANDSNNNVNSNTRIFTIDKNPPNTSIINPANATRYDQNEIINIKVNATDSSGIDKVLANISWKENYQIQELDLQGDYYELNFTNTSDSGYYDIRISANDSFNNINNTESITVKVGVYSLYNNITNATFEIYDQQGLMLYQKTNELSIELENGTYNLAVIMQSGAAPNLIINKIIIDHNIQDIVRIDDTPETNISMPKEVLEWNEAVAWQVNETADYENITINFTYNEGENLGVYKCIDWDYDNRNCTGNWNYLENINVPEGPGSINITFTESDPLIGFFWVPDFNETIMTYDVTNLNETGRKNLGALTGNYTNGTTAFLSTGRSYRIEIHVQETDPFVNAWIQDPYHDNINNNFTITLSGIDAPNITAVNGTITINSFSPSLTSGTELNTQKLTWNAPFPNFVVEDINRWESVKFWYVLDVNSSASNTTQLTRFFGNTLGSFDPEIYLRLSVNDSTPPEFYNASINTTLAGLNEIVKLNQTITDNFEVDQALFNINSNNYTAIPGSYYYNWVCSNNGTYIWLYSYANDTSSNLNSTSIGISWDCDTIPPEINNLEVFPEIVPEETNATLRCNVTDDNLDQVWYLIPNTLESGPMSNTLGSIYEANWTSPETSGSYYFKCYANDTLGQTSFGNISFLVGSFYECMNAKISTGTVYEPGEEIRTSTIIKNPFGELVSNANVTVVLRYPNGTLYQQLTGYELTPGIYKANHTLDSNAAQGTYEAEVTAVNEYCSVYDETVFIVRKQQSGIGGGNTPYTVSCDHLTISSEENYNKNERILISSSVRDQYCSLTNASWINITILHPDSQTVYVNNQAMNLSNTGFYYYIWQAPSNATCGGYEAQVTSNISSNITGLSSTFTISCWIQPEMKVINQAPLNNTYIGYLTSFNFTSLIGAYDYDLKDCRAKISWVPEGITINESKVNELGGLNQNTNITTSWALTGSTPGSYIITVNGECSEGITDSDLTNNITVLHPADISLSKFIEPDWIFANTSEKINVTIRLTNNDNFHNITYLKITDELPYDFSIPSNNSIKVYFMNDSAEILLTSGYNINISNNDLDNNYELLLQIPEFNQTNLGRNLNWNETIKTEYDMNSSLMTNNSTRITYTNASVIDLYNGISITSINKSIKASGVVLRAYKEIFGNAPGDPSNITEIINATALGGSLDQILFSDYLPQGAVINDTKLYYYNSTNSNYNLLINGTDYIVSGPTYSLLPDGNAADVYQYNLSISNPANWDGTIHINDAIILNNTVLLIGGGSWTLPAQIFGFDPLYQQHIQTEVHADYSVPLFDVILEVLTEKVRAGGDVNALLRLVNVGGPRALADVYLTYSIKDSKGTVIMEKSHTLAVVGNKQESLDLPIPDDLPPGKYIFEAMVTYTGREAVSTDYFEVAGIIPLSGDLSYMIILAVVVLGIIGGFLKKFHLLHLPHLPEISHEEKHRKHIKKTTKKAKKIKRKKSDEDDELMDEIDKIIKRI